MELSSGVFYAVVAALFAVAGLSVLIMVKGFAAHLRAVHAFAATVSVVFAVALLVLNPVYGTYGAAWWLVLASFGAAAFLLLEVGLRLRALRAGALDTDHEEAAWQAHLARNRANEAAGNV